MFSQCWHSDSLFHIPVLDYKNKLMCSFMYFYSVTFLIVPKHKNILEIIRKNQYFMEGIWLSSLNCTIFIWMWAVPSECQTESKETPCLNLSEVLQQFEGECWQAV